MTNKPSDTPTPNRAKTHGGVRRAVMKLRFLAIVVLAGVVIGAVIGAVIGGLYIERRTAQRPPLLENIPFSTAYYDRNGTLLRLTLADDDMYRLYTPLAQISPDIIAATLMQEDRHFHRHFGVNPVSLMRGAYATYVKRNRAIGGSTITMQLVRLRDHLDTRSPAGKAEQIIRALALERHYSKAEILDAYLNLAPYGGNIHGAGTAALLYFGSSAKTLSLPESIALAVIPQNPVRRNPYAASDSGQNESWAAARQRLFRAFPTSVQQRYAAFIGMPLGLRTRQDLPFLAPHFIDGLEQAKAATKTDSAPPPPSGSVVTTIDLPLQRLLESRLTAYIQARAPMGLRNAAALLVHVPDMQIHALVGSSDFHSRAIDGQVDGTSALRSPGSTLKPFVYALALEQGLIHPETLLEDDPAYFSEYRPGNFDHRFMGLIPAREALALSRNIPAITLATRIHSPDLYEFLQRAGANFPQNRRHYGLSLIVGGAETDMRTLAKLYAMLAAGGVLRDLNTNTNADPSGHSAPELGKLNELSGLRMLSPEAAFVTLSMLERPAPNALAFVSGYDTPPVYWKTGTSNGFRDAWTVGVFGSYVLVVWAGNFDGSPNAALVGAESAAPLFFDMIRAMQRRTPQHDIVKPALETLNVAHVAICSRTGELAGELAQNIAAPASPARAGFAVTSAALPPPCGAVTSGLFIPGRSPFAAIHAPQKTLDILTPRSGVAYTMRIATPSATPAATSRTSQDTQTIPFEAKAAPDALPLYWYVGNKLVGVAADKAPLFWPLQTGSHVVRVVDSKGRSDSRVINVIPAR